MKKVGLLVITLIAALGALGVGYAMWSDTIFVDGSVDTGTICMKWYKYTNSDVCVGTEGDRPTATPVIGADPRWYEDITDPTEWDKNVACTKVTVIDDHTLEITVTDAYPGYYADWELEWINCGTIPVKIQYAYIISDFPIDTSAEPDWTSWETNPIWIDWTVNDDEVRGVQLEPGIDGASSFKLLVMQSAEQGKDYTFRVVLEAVQWNEYDSTLPLIPADLVGAIYTSPL